MNTGLSVGNALWRESSEVERKFVRVRHPDPPSGHYWHIPCLEGGPPQVSVIIPTGDADREGQFQRLLNQLDGQSLRKFEIIVVKGDRRQGRAINTGAQIATGKYLLTLDDDTSLVEPRAIERLVDVLERYPDIGAAGGNNVVPDDAPRFVKKAMRQIPRRSWEPVKDITDSDLAQHGCLLMRMETFREIGGENELMPRGLDPYLREEFRKMGKRIVLVPGVNYHHLMPSDLGSIMKQSFYNGSQAAYANRACPQWIYETPSRHGKFKSRLPLPLRILRYPARMLGALLGGRPIWFFSQTAYATGFCAEWLFPKKK